MLKAALAFLPRLLHAGRHKWERYLDMPEDIWPLKAPYMEICKCGATRLRETKPDD